MSDSITFELGQYNSPTFENMIVNTGEDTEVKQATGSKRVVDKFMKHLKGWAPARRQTLLDKNVLVKGVIAPFWDECIRHSNSNALQGGLSYYFHAHIKRMKTDQVYYIYLVKFEEAKQSDQSSQYIKEVVVAAKNKNNGDWVEIEMIFTPIQDYDTILLQLQRSTKDYSSPRIPSIVYEEISKIENLLPIFESEGSGIKYLTKMGVQSHPAFLMCINGEEIRVGSTGQYEVRNGIVAVDMFGAVQASYCTDTTTPPSTLDEDTVINKSRVHNPAMARAYVTVKELKEAITENSIGTDDKEQSPYGFSLIEEENKARDMKAFAIDYIARKETT